MKPRVLFLLTLATSTLAAADSSKAPAERPRLTDEMRRSVASTSIDSNGQAATTAGNDALMMAPVRVTGTYQPTSRRPGEDDPKSQPFNWTEGGTFLKDEGLQFTTELKTQFNARHKGWDLLSFSW